MIHEDNDGLDFLKSIKNGTFKQGLGIDAELDIHLRYKKTDFTIFAGHANVGKTLAVLYYFVCLAIKHKLKFVVFSSENDIGSLKDDLMTLYTSKKIKDLTGVEFDYAHYWINTHFKFFDADRFADENKRMMHFKDILDECASLDFDALVIDPYNSLGRLETIKGNTHEYDYTVMSHLRTWCKIEEKALYLLAHGNTEALRRVHPKGHDFEGYPIALSSADIEGGGKFVNRADNFVSIHRMTQHPTEWMKTEWHVKKVKNTKTGGKPTFKENPVIFKAKRDLLGFYCYVRNDDYRIEPTQLIDPLKPNKQNLIPFEKPLRHNTEFETEINEIEPF